MIGGIRMEKILDIFMQLLLSIMLSFVFGFACSITKDDFEQEFWSKSFLMLYILYAITEIMHKI